MPCKMNQMPKHSMPCHTHISTYTQIYVKSSQALYVLPYTTKHPASPSPTQQAVLYTEQAHTRKKLRTSANRFLLHV